MKTEEVTQILRKQMAASDWLKEEGPELKFVPAPKVTWWTRLINWALNNRSMTASTVLRVYQVKSFFPGRAKDRKEAKGETAGQ